MSCPPKEFCLLKIHVCKHYRFVCIFGKKFILVFRPYHIIYWKVLLIKCFETNCGTSRNSGRTRCCSSPSSFPSRTPTSRAPGKASRRGTLRPWREKINGSNKRLLSRNKKKTQLSFYKRKKFKVSKLALLLGRDLGYFLFLGFFLLVFLVKFVFSYFLSWLKACSLFFFLKYFFLISHLCCDTGATSGRTRRPRWTGISPRLPRRGAAGRSTLHRPPTTRTPTKSVITSSLGSPCRLGLIILRNTLIKSKICQFSKFNLSKMTRIFILFSAHRNGKIFKISGPKPMVPD